MGTVGGWAGTPARINSSVLVREAAHGSRLMLTLFHASSGTPDIQYLSNAQDYVPGAESTSHVLTQWIFTLILWGRELQFYRWGDWGTEKLCKVPRVTCQIRVNSRFEPTQFCLSDRPPQFIFILGGRLRDTRPLQVLQVRIEINAED